METNKQNNLLQSQSIQTKPECDRQSHKRSCIVINKFDGKTRANIKSIISSKRGSLIVNKFDTDGRVKIKKIVAKNGGCQINFF